MEKILNAMIEGITSGNAFVIAVIIAIAIIFNIEKIFSFLDSRKKVKIKLIEESINNPHVSGNTKLYLEGLIEAEYFKSITGIALEKKIREALIQAHQKTNGELMFKHYKRAIPYLSYKDSVLSVRISLFSMTSFIYNSIFGLLNVVVGFIFFLLPSFSSEITAINASYDIYGIAIFMVIVGVAMLLQCIPVISAKFVQRALERIHKNPTQPTDSASTD